MRALFVYDVSIQTATDLGPILSVGLDVVLFPLLEDDALRESLTGDLEHNSTFVVETLCSARLVERQVSKLGACAEWSASLGASEVGGSSIKKHLLIPGFPLSAWWLGHISERNPLKTEAFLQLAQLAAVREAIAADKFDCLILAVGDPVLRRSLALLGKEAKLCLKIVNLKRQLTFKQRIIAATQILGVAGEILRACYTWMFFLRRALIARRVMAGCSRSPATPDSSLFVSHFAAVDNDSAEEGIFRNKYFMPLQELMASHGKNITWLLLYVPIYGYSFRQACELAKNFSMHGERLAILEEYLSLPRAFTAFALWLRISFRAMWLHPRIDRKVLYHDTVGPASDPVIRKLWWSSHCGPTAMEGMLYLMMFDAYLKRMTPHADALYFFENYPLEKALLSMGRKHWPKTRFLAYQHTTIPRNLFPYFCSHQDTKCSNLSEDMPLPDLVIANGRASRLMLEGSAFPRVVEAEAIRYFYIDRVLSETAFLKSNHPTLLIAGSHDRGEMISTMRLVKARLNALEGYDIWVKGHPGLPLGPILDEVGIHPLPSSWVLRNEDISQLLPLSWAVLVPASTVAVEAVAAGCEVIVPVFPDVLGLSPLSNHEGYCHKVYSGADLENILTRIRERGPSEGRRTRGREFIRRYWNLDQAMPLWSRLLFEPGGVASDTTLR